MSRFFPYYPPQQDPYQRAYERWPYDYYQPYDEGYMRPAPYYDAYNTYRQPPYQVPMYPYEPQYQAPQYMAPQNYGYGPQYPYQYDYQPAYQAPVYPTYEPQYQVPQYPVAPYEPQPWAPQYAQPQYQAPQPQYQPAPQYQPPYQQPQRAPAAPQYQPPYQPQEFQPQQLPQYQVPQYQTPQYQAPQPQYQPAPQYVQPQAPRYPEPNYQAPQPVPQYQPQPAPQQPVAQPAAPQPQPVAQPEMPAFHPVEAAPVAPAAPAAPVAPAAQPEPAAPAFVPAPEVQQPVPAAPVAEPAAPKQEPRQAPVREVAEKAVEAFEQEMLEKSYLAQFAPAPMHYNPVPKKQEESAEEERVDHTEPEMAEPPVEEPAPVEEPESVAEEDVFVFAPPQGLDLNMGYLFRSFEEKLQEVSEPQQILEVEEEPEAEEPESSIDEMIAELDAIPEAEEKPVSEYEVFDLESEFAAEPEEESLEDIIREVMAEPQPVAEEPELIEEPAEESETEPFEPDEAEEVRELTLDEFEQELLPVIEELEPSEGLPEDELTEEPREIELFDEQLQQLLPDEDFDSLLEPEEAAEEDYPITDELADDRAEEIFPVIIEESEELPEPEIFEGAEAAFEAFDLEAEAEEKEIPEAEELPAEEEMPFEEILAEEAAEEEISASEEAPEEEAPAEEPESVSQSTAGGMDYEGFGFPDPTTTREISRRQIMEALEEKLRAEQQAQQEAPALSFETGEFIFPDIEEEEADYETGIEPARSYEDSLPAAEETVFAIQPQQELPEEQPEAESGFSFDDAFSEIDRIEEELKKAVVLRDYVDCYSENNLFSYKQRACFEIKDAVSEYNIQYGDNEPQPLFEGVSLLIPAASCTAVVSDEPSAVYELVRYFGTRGGAEEAAPSDVWPRKVVYIDGSEQVFGGSVLDYLASHAGESNRSICQALLAELGLGKVSELPMQSMDEGKRALLAMLAAETDPDVDAVVVNFEDLQPQQEDISRFGRLVNLLCRQGTTVVFGCCSTDLAGECANYVVALLDGKLEFAGSYIDFTNKYCIRIMSFETDDESIVVQASRMFSDLRFELSGNTVTVCGDAGSAEVAEQLIEAVQDLGVDMDRVVMAPKTFESAVEEMLK